MRPTKIIETFERRNSGLHSADFHSIQKTDWLDSIRQSFEFGPSAFEF